LGRRDESAENIANKISRGKFTAVFLLQCLEAVGCKIDPALGRCGLIDTVSIDRLD
jgi:hypothetical protein